jgi:hypothetical protein
MLVWSLSTLLIMVFNTEKSEFEHPLREGGAIVSSKLLKGFHKRKKRS